MAKHKFDGKWSYYDSDRGNFPPTSPNGPKKVVLKIEDDGNGNGPLLPGSVLENDDVTGDAYPGRIVMREVAHGIDNSYVGYLIFEHDHHLMLVGTWVDNNATERKKARGRLFDDGQADGVWVMTKP